MNYQKLFDTLKNMGITALETDMQEIVRAVESDAYNQGVRDAAENVELHTPTTAPPKIGKWHSLPINKQSILKLLKP